MCSKSHCFLINVALMNTVDLVGIDIQCPALRFFHSEITVAVSSLCFVWYVSSKLITITVFPMLLQLEKMK